MSCSLWMLSVAVLIASGPVLAGVQTVPCPRNGALTKTDLLSLVSNQVSERRVVQFLDTCGVQFEVTAEAESDLRAVGASASVIDALRAAGERYARATAEAKSAREEAEGTRRRAEETDEWARVKSSGGIEEFLLRFPNGPFASAARARLAVLRAAADTFVFRLEHYHTN